MKQIFALIVSIFITLSTLNFSSVNVDAFKRNLTKNIETSQSAFLQNQTVVGSEVLINYNGETVYSKSFGTRTVGGEALKGNELYRLCSMTKPITAVALLMEYQKGNLDIFKNVSDYLPQFKDMKIEKKDGSLKKNITPIKVYQLVSHTSGLGGIDKVNEMSVYNDMMADKVPFSYEEVANRLSKCNLGFRPGTDRAYSTIGFDVAARIIEITSGKKFEDYIKENIFDKLGMVDTTFEPTAEQWKRTVALTGLSADGKAYDVENKGEYVFAGFPSSFHLAGGSLVSTASDYMKFARMLLNDGVGDNGVRILNKEMVKIMSTPVSDEMRFGIISMMQRWGLGVRVIIGPGKTIPIGSFGWSGAYGSHFWVDKKNNIVGVYMRSSTHDGADVSSIIAQVEKDVMKALKES